MKSDSSDYELFGYLASLIPTTWSVDSVFVDGFNYTGPYELMGWAEQFEWPCDSYPPPPGYGWFVAWGGMHQGYYGDTGQAFVTIVSDDSLGSFSLAFLAAVHDPMDGGYLWTGDPCSCVVQIVPLSLEQRTWGSIKSGISD